MNAALPGALDEAPADLVDTMTNHPKDRHVLAFAIHVGARRIVTSNLRDFPDATCNEHRLEAISPNGVRHAAHIRGKPANTADDGLNFEQQLNQNCRAQFAAATTRL